MILCASKLVLDCFVEGAVVSRFPLRFELFCDYVKFYLMYIYVGSIWFKVGTSMNC